MQDIRAHDANAPLKAEGLERFCRRTHPENQKNFHMQSYRSASLKRTFVLLAGANVVALGFLILCAWLYNASTRAVEAAHERASLSYRLADELRQKAVEDRVNELTAASEIERPEIEDLDPAILKDLSLVRN